MENEYVFARAFQGLFSLSLRQTVVHQQLVGLIGPPVDSLLSLSLSLSLSLCHVIHVPHVHARMSAPRRASILFAAGIAHRPLSLSRSTRDLFGRVPGYRYFAHTRVLYSTESYVYVCSKRESWKSVPTSSATTRGIAAHFCSLFL